MWDMDDVDLAIIAMAFLGAVFTVYNPDQSAPLLEKIILAIAGLAGGRKLASRKD